MSDEGLSMCGAKPEDMSMGDFKSKLFEAMEAMGAKPVQDAELPLCVSLEMAESSTRDVIKGIHKWLKATDEEMNAQIAPAKELVLAVVNSDASNGSELIIRFGFVALEIFRLLAHFQDKLDNSPAEEFKQDDAGVPQNQG